jgi:hypothetical protein
MTLTAHQVDGTSGSAQAEKLPQLMRGPLDGSQTRVSVTNDQCEGQQLG